MNEGDLDTSKLDFDADEIFVIYEGAVEVYIEVDGTNEVTLEILTKGSVLRPAHYLVNR